tara:strand:- start:996 stop:1877 length:882 start_codon:yes stop_codon:yes gene_type:complete
MRTITILGGSGFLGSQLSFFLSKNSNNRVIIFDKKKTNKIEKNQKFIKGNILNTKQLSRAIKKSDYVFNFAALADLNDARNKPLETAMINVIGTIKALQISKKFKVKKFIQASSIYANSEQGGFYGSSKKAAEDYIEKFNKKFKLKFTILRFGSLFGNGADRSNGINIIIDYALKNESLLYKGSKKAARKYIHVLDACRACAKAISKKYDNKYLNITGKNKIKITKLLNIMSDITNISKKKIFYKNFPNEGHYISEPKKFIPRRGINLNLIKYQDFKKGLTSQYIERKKKYKL